MFSISIIAQTKVSGVVYDDMNTTVPYANICFKGTRECVTSDENGRFYLESESDRKILSVSYVGFQAKEIVLTKAVNYNMKISFAAANTLQEVKIYSGKTSKKNNPALDILRKIWAHKRKNGLHMFNQYQMNKYEKK